LAQHAQSPIIAPGFNPALLARAQALDEDVAHFTGSLDWRDEPLARALRAGGECAELDAYLARIAELRDASDDAPVASTSSASFVYPPPAAAPMFLLAHAYVRYMGPS